MQANYLEAVSSVLKLMEQPDSKCKDTSSHKTCYYMLFKHLMEKSIPFSLEAALEWLEEKKPFVSNETFSKYRNALFRLEHYLLFGNINSPFCRSEEDFQCRSGMSESFYFLTFELQEHLEATQNSCYYHTYSVAIKSFFRMATSLGITEPESITLDTLITYIEQYCITLPSESRRRNAVWAARVVMKYLHERKDVPGCYQAVLLYGNIDRLSAMELRSKGNAFHPSVGLEEAADGFLNALEDWKYKESSRTLYQNDLIWYFLFLELNRLPHCPESVEKYISALPEYPNQKRSNCSVSARREHTIHLFSEYLENTMIGNVVYEHPKNADLLPEWSRTILLGFLENRRRDGMANSTLTMCRTAGYRFFHYLDSVNVRSADEITPELVMAFHAQDKHSTPESNNAYSIKIRQLLRFMADEELVPYTLAFAISTSCAPRRNIVDVLSDEMVEKIYEYRKTATTPLELRDSAIVMLGLRMGIRGVDIINLRVDDFDWNAKTVSFVQRKTRTAITLPVPTDVGNSVYQYIVKGRPASAESGKGYIFIRHQAPYVPLNATIACKGALQRILRAYGFELSPGQGFHMTRKTFATKLLRAESRLDDISNALGHARQETAEVYLERDEAGMRSCPINFGGVLS